MAFQELGAAVGVGRHKVCPYRSIRSPDRANVRVSVFLFSNMFHLISFPRTQERLCIMEILFGIFPHPTVSLKRNWQE